MQTLTVVYFSLPSLTLTSFISHFHNTCSVDHKYYWEIVVLLRKLCIGIIVSFFTVEPLVAIPLQFLIIFVSICMQLRWGPYISVKNRCGVCGSGRWRKISVRCCRGANNRIELILMIAECLLLVAGFANAAVGGTGVIGAAAGLNNQTVVLQRARALSDTISGFIPVDSAALNAAVGTCNWRGVCSGGCLGETPDGSCPTFAASNDATGNPYGVMGDWDVSKVTSLSQSTSTPSSFLLFLVLSDSVLTQAHCFFSCFLFAFFWWTRHQHPPTAFDEASKFNADLSKWNTVAVTNMHWSMCSL